MAGYAEQGHIGHRRGARHGDRHSSPGTELVGVDVDGKGVAADAGGAEVLSGDLVGVGRRVASMLAKRRRPGRFR